MMDMEQVYSIADQALRFTIHKTSNNQRVLDIDSVYDGSELEGKRVLVTGGNRGLGLALARQLKADGARAVVTCRKSSPELDAVGVELVVDGIDVSRDEDMPKLVAALEGSDPLDVVINNAGYFYGPIETLESLNMPEELKMINICALGPLRVSAALVNAGLVKEGGKVAVISSQSGSVTWRDVQNHEGHDYGHHMSKAAANMMAKLLSKELAPKEIAVLLLHPGFNRTDMTKKLEAVWDREGAVDISVGAKRVLHAVNVGSMESSGKLVNCEDGLLIPF